MIKKLHCCCSMCGADIHEEHSDENKTIEVFTVTPACREGTAYPRALEPSDENGIEKIELEEMRHSSFCAECATNYYTDEPRTSSWYTDKRYRCGSCGSKIADDEPFFVLSLTHCSDPDFDPVSEFIEVREVVPVNKYSPDTYRCIHCVEEMFDIEDEEDPYSSVYRWAEILGYFCREDKA